jgi:hypothetical protein
MVEDLPSLKLSSDTTVLQQEIWAIKQRQRRQALPRKAYMWMAIQGDEICVELSSRLAAQDDNLDDSTPRFSI